MCGLVAIVNLDGRAASATVLKNMADQIAHRGPDDEGVWLKDNVGCYHKRLSIIDIESGVQPMSRSGVTVVFNGEIYNYIELRGELGRLGVEFSTKSDTEVLLACYLQYGSDFVRKLNGMFAFVIYDGRTNQVFAARDHFGIKPLYRYQDDCQVLYASEIKALLRHPEVDAEVDQMSLNQYLTFQHTLEERTFFRGISRVLPATYEALDLNNAGNRVQTRYWSPDYSIDGTITEEAAVEELRSLLRRSVSIQLRSDVPVGAYLSGGLDSSTVTALAVGGYEGSLSTFTGAFREGVEFDESRYAAEMAKSAGTDQHLIYCTEHEFIDALSSLAYAMDEPAAGPGLFPQFMVSKLAAKHVKVCLGGQGGDEIFGGYARYPIAYLETALKAAIEGTDTTVGDQISLEEMAGSLSALGQYQPLLKRFFGTGMFDAEARRYFFMLDRSEGNLDAFSRDFMKSYDHEEVFEQFKLIFDEANTDSYLNRMLNFDMMASLPALLQVEDRVSMAVSLESRVPLLDHEIVDFVASLPARIKLRHGEPKYLFKQAVRDWLPEEILNRKDKMGFPVPLHLWSKGAARDFIADTLLSRTCRDRGLFDQAEVERLMLNESAFGRGLWGLLQIELWFQVFIDKNNQPKDGEKQHAAVIH